MDSMSRHLILIRVVHAFRTKLQAVKAYGTKSAHF